MIHGLTNPRRTRGRTTDRTRVPCLVIDAMATRLADVTARTRKRIERTAGVDAISADLLIRIAGSLEKQLWLIRAQRDRA
jgi:DNA-binding ferritin-like protein